MEISDGSESLFFETNTNGRYNEEQLKSMEFSDDTKSNSDEEETDLNSSRQENLDWFKCSRCTIMPTFIEGKCCKEFKDLLDDKLSAGCVTNHEALDTLILSKSILEVAFMKHRRYNNNFTEVKEITVDSL